MPQYFLQRVLASSAVRPQRFLAMLCLVASVTACASMGDFESGLKPFTTDGCSLFPDRSYITKADWCSCCVAHDLAYWRGGTEADRLKADQALKDCVRNTTKNPVLANLMFDGVRLGGGPFFFTSYRWGYGWKVGRGYMPLTAEESADADRLEAEYRKVNPDLKCQSNTNNFGSTCSQ